MSGRGDEFDGGGDEILSSACSFADSSRSEGSAWELADEDLFARSLMVREACLGTGLFLVTSLAMEERFLCNATSVQRRSEKGKGERGRGAERRRTLSAVLFVLSTRAALSAGVNLAHLSICLVQ